MEKAHEISPYRPQNWVQSNPGTQTIRSNNHNILTARNQIIISLKNLWIDERTDFFCDLEGTDGFNISWRDMERKLGRERRSNKRWHAYLGHSSRTWLTVCLLWLQSGQLGLSANLYLNKVSLTPAVFKRALTIEMPEDLHFGNEIRDPTYGIKSLVDWPEGHRSHLFLPLLLDSIAHWDSDT